MKVQKSRNKIFWTIQHRFVCDSQTRPPAELDSSLPSFPSNPHPPKAARPMAPTSSPRPPTPLIVTHAPIDLPSFDWKQLLQTVQTEERKANRWFLSLPPSQQAGLTIAGTGAGTLALLFGYKRFWRRIRNAGESRSERGRKGGKEGASREGGVELDVEASERDGDCTRGEELTIFRRSRGA